MQNDDTCTTVHDTLFSFCWLSNMSVGFSGASVTVWQLLKERQHQLEKWNKKMKKKWAYITRGLPWISPWILYVPVIWSTWQEKKYVQLASIHNSVLPDKLKFDAMFTTVAILKFVVGVSSTGEPGLLVLGELTLGDWLSKTPVGDSTEQGSLCVWSWFLFSFGLPGWSFWKGRTWSLCGLRSHGGWSGRAGVDPEQMSPVENKDNVFYIVTFFAKTWLVQLVCFLSQVQGLSDTQ